ncbi:hypothetical protein D3C83_292400 [compost metagenome]
MVWKACESLLAQAEEDVARRQFVILDLVHEIPADKVGGLFVHSRQQGQHLGRGCVA